MHASGPGSRVWIKRYVQAVRPRACPWASGRCGSTRRATPSSSSPGDARIRARDQGVHQQTYAGCTPFRPALAEHEGAHAELLVSWSLLRLGQGSWSGSGAVGPAHMCVIGCPRKVLAYAPVPSEHQEMFGKQRQPQCMQAVPSMCTGGCLLASLQGQPRDCTACRGLSSHSLVCPAPSAAHGSRQLAWMRRLPRCAAPARRPRVLNPEPLGLPQVCGRAARGARRGAPHQV